MLTTDEPLLLFDSASYILFAKLLKELRIVSVVQSDGPSYLGNGAVAGPTS